MKTGKTLIELATEIERRAGAKQDVIVNTQRVEVIPRDKAVALHFGAFDATINQLAHRQIGESLKIPAAYYDKMLAEDTPLLADNIRAWFRRYPAKQMVRMLDGQVRAFLSERYRPLENEDLAMAVMPVLQALDLDLMSSEITDRRLYIKAVDKKVNRELAKVGAAIGDGGHTFVRVAAPAITISNSEVGLGALSVQVGYYDSFCSNLATFGERSMRKYHVGGKQAALGEDVYALLSDESRKLGDQALWSAIGDVVKGAFDADKFGQLIDRVEGTAADEITGDVVEVINLASKKFSLTETEGKGILAHLIKGGSLTRFGLLNAVTRMSQDVDSYDRATELERLGGEIVELPQDQWRVLAEAA